MMTENNFSENEENNVPKEPTTGLETSNSSADANALDDSMNHEQEPQTEHDELIDHTTDSRSVEDITSEMEKIINKPSAGSEVKSFNQLKVLATAKITEEKEEKKHEYLEQGNSAENFSWEHPQQSRLNLLVNLFREKHDEFVKKQESEHAENLSIRQTIVEKLKSLYTNTEAGTNLFKAIREIKEEWKNAGQISKADFKIVNNNYFHHLNQFYQMLDLNKEYLEQEYAHNLETRQHIILRAKELENEPVVQKALNELQYLHKLWKEEAEPVAEEFREQTWEEFREISNKIHLRKAELSSQIEEEQAKNLERKNKVISEIKKFIEESQTSNHNFWQAAIKKVEDLRTDFLKTGSVPRKLSNQNWNEFKSTLREFNSKKNEFYKSLKGSQQTNLERKLQLIQTAKDNMLSQDWETAVPLFKKLQEEWKNIGHVPRSMANKVWDEFRDACNTFFKNFRDQNQASADNWKENYRQKRTILDDLKEVSSEEGSVEKIEALKTAWNSIGKVPRDKISINNEFNKVLREKLKLNKINEFDLKEEGLSENQLTDKARKIKSQISELEAEVVNLENNLGFFTNSNRENPLLKETYNSIDEKKAQIESLKHTLHNIIVGEGN